MTIPEKTADRNYPSIWLFIALFLTIIYITVLWLAADVTVDISGEIRDCNSDGMLAKWFGCLTMNELGDFLAGAFAPLAFIWLAAAVLIQSQELQAQRKELTLTRREFKLNRVVMQAQAAEARKQAEYIGQQTEILEREQKTREDAERVRVFDAAIERLVARIKDNHDCLSFTDFDEKITPITNVNVYDIIRNSEDGKGIIREISRIFSIQEFNNLINVYRGKKLKIVHPQAFRDVQTACRQAIILIDDLPQESIIMVEEIGLENLFNALTWVSSEANNLHSESENAW